VDRELAESKLDVEIKNVRLAKSGCCITFPSKPGIVTMANLLGRKGTYRMAIIVGEALSTTMVFPGNPIKIELPFPIDLFLDLVETGGFGHHWVVAYGDISEELEKLGELMDLDVLHFNHQAST
jgi:L-arabinose isomerase